MINENYKILTTSDTNPLPSDDELLETPLVSSTDETLTDPNLFLFQKLQFSTSTSTAHTIHSTVASVTTTLHSKENSNQNKHDLKDGRIEQLNVELKALKSFISEELYLMKKMIEDLQDQKTTQNHSIVTKSLKEELIRAIFGFKDVLDHNFLLVNHLILLFKYNIYNSRVDNAFSFQSLKCVIFQIKYTEETISNNNLNKKRKILNKWKLIDHLF